MDASNVSSKGETTKPKNLTPAVLGIPKSHGVKLSLMTSEDKREFMQKLEKWRQERREKLAAKILAKQKVVEKPKPPFNFGPGRTKSIVPSLGGISKSQDKESVFERLYKGNGKFKKPEMSDNSNKIAEVKNFKKPALATASRPLKFTEIDTLPSKTLKPSECELIPVENLNGLISLSNGSEVSTEGIMQTTFQEPSKTTDSTFENFSEFAEHPLKSSELKPVESKSTMTKKVETNKSSRFTETTCKNLPKVPLRRSISMLFRQKSKTKNVIKKSLSAKNIHELQGAVSESVDNEPKPKSETIAKSVSFLTPKTKQFSPANLRSKLEDWLKMNGHSLEGYRHLRCFEIENTNVLRPPPPAHSHNLLENSQISTTPGTPLDESDKENMTPPTVISQVDVTQVENWLKELHVLISKMKYPSDRCEEWLAAIRKKYPKCSQLPAYWECRAALNESKGDMKSAIEDYERVIIKGGQVESVGNSLAQLFDKMVLEEKKPTKSKMERGIDPKNIFKSTIIKFALQQKTLRKLGPEMAQSVREQLYVATPVRRSSRIQTPLKSKEVDSLETLTPDVKRNLTFKPNESLLEAD